MFCNECVQFHNKYYLINMYHEIDNKQGDIDKFDLQEIKSAGQFFFMF